MIPNLGSGSSLAVGMEERKQLWSPLRSRGGALGCAPIVRERLRRLSVYIYLAAAVLITVLTLGRWNSGFGFWSPYDQPVSEGGWHWGKVEWKLNGE